MKPTKAKTDMKECVSDLKKEIRRLKRIETASIKTILSLGKLVKKLRKDLLDTHMELIEETERSEDLENEIKKLKGKRNAIQKKRLHT